MNVINKTETRDNAKARILGVAENRLFSSCCDEPLQMLSMKALCELSECTTQEQLSIHFHEEDERI